MRSKYKFLKPRQGFGYFAGDIADLPDEIAKQLMEEGFVMSADTPDVIESDLPDSLPGRQILIANGLVNKANVIAASETLRDLKGIGKKMSEEILTQLNG